MNTDFRMRVGWSTHPKFLKLENRLGDHGVLSFIRLIEWTAANKPDGTLVHMDTEDICLAARYKGDGDFVAALVNLRLLDQSGDVYRLHDWAEHNPFAAGADDRKRQAEFAVAVRWENDRRRQLGEKPMNESDKTGFRIQWECSKPQGQYCENTTSINQYTDSNTPSYPTSPSEPTEPKPTEEDPPFNPPAKPGGKRQTSTVKFVVPDPHDVAAYFREIGGTGEEARRYFNHFKANGWMAGRVKMKDWKAAADNWHDGRFIGGSRASPGRNGHGGVEVSAAERAAQIAAELRGEA